MKKENQTELDRICTEVCDDICHWPHVITDQEKMTEKCDGCRIPIDLANLVERAEGK